MPSNSQGEIPQQKPGRITKFLSWSLGIALFLAARAGDERGRKS